MARGEKVGECVGCGERLTGNSRYVNDGLLLWCLVCWYREGRYNWDE